MRPILLSSIIALAAIPGTARGQLTLHDALVEADHNAFANRAAAGAVRTQSAQAIAPLKGILPRLELEAGYVRTTDPIGTFGSTLKQRSIAQSDFAPARLNFPDAVGNYQTGIVAQLPVFNADAWAGRRAASLAADATRASEQWAIVSTRVDVVKAYYGVVLAAERIATLEIATRAAHAHVAQARSMTAQGLVTASDALLASVREGDVETRLVEAHGALTTARRQFAAALGREGAQLPSDITLSSMPSSDRIRDVTASDTLERLVHMDERADVRAASTGLDAANADLRRARTAYLPRVNTFARYDWNSSARPYGGEKSWTAGVMATWSVPGSVAELAEMQMARGRLATSQAQAAGAEAQARVDVEQSRVALAVALTRLTIAERSVAQSAEAHRIVSKKYGGGLATIVELLDAQATEIQSALALSHARYGAIVAAAERRRAIGGDPASLAALDQPARVATQSPE